MSKKRFRKNGINLILVGVLIAVSIVAYMWLKPHRDVQNTDAYATLKVSELINEFNTDTEKANAKYLSSDGNSKVLIIEGPVHSISINQNQEKVVLLKDADAKAGVSATFSIETGKNIDNIKVGENIKVKGAITTGNLYDDDLDLYEHAILIKSDIVK